MNMTDNNGRGLQNADKETRERVAKMGGDARANDEDVRSGELGRKGGEARADDEDVRSGELGRMGAEARWNKEDQNEEDKTNNRKITVIRQGTYTGIVPYSCE